MEDWTRYFKVIGIVPGKVVTRLLGPVDLSNTAIPVEKIQQLYEADSPYLQLTPLGEKELYGIGATPEPIPQHKPAPKAFVAPDPLPASGPVHDAFFPELKTNPDDSDEDPFLDSEERRGKSRKRRSKFDWSSV